MQEKMRTDVTDSFEDMERVLEDYFLILPSDMHYMKMESVIQWEYDDSTKSITFYFADEWSLDEFFDKLKYSPKMMMFHCEEHDCVDRKNFSLTIFGKTGGLY